MKKFDRGIRIRNEILVRVANEPCIPGNDLYSVMGEGIRLTHADHVHYEKAAKYLFADRLTRYYRGESE